MNLKNLLINNKLTKLFIGLPLFGKIGVSAGAFFVGKGIVSSLYSKVYNFTHFDSMHSGKETSFSNYSNMAMTDFGSGWKGLNNNILKLIGAKNVGMSSLMKTNLTAFTDEGIDLGKTMIKMRKRKKHMIVNIAEKLYNPTLDLAKNVSVGHIIS